MSITRALFTITMCILTLYGMHHTFPHYTPSIGMSILIGALCGFASWVLLAILDPDDKWI